MAESGEKIIGTVMGAWDGHRGWIYHLGVLPERRREGIAGRLVIEVESRMRAKGVLKVNAIIYRWNKPSLEFFKQMGYLRDRRATLHGKVLKGE